jgi:Tol biopolymer transport system component
MCLVAGASAAVAQTISLVSVPDLPGGQSAGGGGESIVPVLSFDGRYVLFSSTANNLALTSSNTPFATTFPPRLNVFLRDATHTTLVSLNALGTGGGNGDSIATDLANYGQYALFESSASDLAPGDTNNCNDVFWRDMTRGTTRLVSAGFSGGVGSGPSRESCMTADGRYVAFVSDASNLVAGDTNRIADVFVMDMESNRMTLVSVGAVSTNATTPVGGSSDPDITWDGRYVAFRSSATNLVPGVRAGGDIYVRDLVAGVTYWASADARAEMAAVPWLGNTNYAVMSHPMISWDGQYVVYRVSSGGGSAGLILRYSLETGLTEVVYTNAFVVAATGSDEMRCMDMTPDGEFIAFMANASTSGSDLGKTSCIRVWDGLSGQVLLASPSVSGAVPSGSIVGWPAIDSTGRFVAFMSPMTNQPYNPVFVTNVLNPGYHLYLRDLQAGHTKLVDAAIYGTGCGVSSTALSRLSAGGQYIAFEAPDGNLVPSDSNRASDVFLRDLITGTTTLVSARASSLPSVTPNGSPAGWPMSASADGRYIAFTSEAETLSPDDQNKCQDVFVRDLAAGATYLVSARTNSMEPGEGSSVEPSLSASGRYVAFTSYATNMVTGDSNKARDVFVRDLQAGTTTLVSVRLDGSGPGTGDSYGAQLSGNGQRVLFRSTAKDLATATYGTASENLFLRDLQAGTTRALTDHGVSSAAMTPDGRWVAFIGAVGSITTNLYLWDAQSAARVYTNTASGLALVTISRDGARLACAGGAELFGLDWRTGTTWSLGALGPSSRVGMKFSADGRFLTYASTNAQVGVDTNGTYDVYLADLQTSSKLLVSQAYGLARAANAASDCPDISADGRFVTYRSVATNLLPGVTNGVGHVFIFDRTTGGTTLLSMSRSSSGPGDNWSFRPLFTPDGHKVLFQSWASDLVGFDFNHAGDVFAYGLFYVQAARAGPYAAAPTLSWPAASNSTYRVQFRNNVRTAAWQEAGGTVTVIADTAYFTDPSPGAGQRFYRIVRN